MTRVISTATTFNCASLKAFLKPLAALIALSASAAPAFSGTILLDSFNDNGIAGAPAAQPPLFIFETGGTAPLAIGFTHQNTLSTSADFFGTQRITNLQFDATPPNGSVAVSQVQNSQISSDSPLGEKVVLDLDYSWAPAIGNIFNGASNLTGLSLVGASSIASGGATTAFDVIIDIFGGAGQSTYSNSFTPTGSDIDIDFADFTGTADLANAFAINFNFVTGTNTGANDFLLGGINVLTDDGGITPVPLPAALPLLLMAIGTLGAYRSMRRA